VTEVSRAVRPQVGIVVLNWNGADDTIACMKSLRGSTIPAHLIVVDNGSVDGSAQLVRATGLADDVIETGKNLGYAAGNNAGLRLALEKGFETVIVMNNDTLVEPDAIEALCRALPRGELRAVSPTIDYVDRRRGVWFSGGVIDRGWPRHLQPGEASSALPLRASPCLTGCCIAARREVWERVGLFDPAYFLIFEDSDWCARARAAGTRLYVVSGSRIRHRVSRSFEAGPASLLGSFYFIRNGLRFEYQYFLRYMPHFAAQWLLRPMPQLVRARRVSEVAFRWLGALAFVMGQRGRAPARVQKLADRLSRSHTNRKSSK
jgi:GT2 family glycosyltransferase